MPLVCHFHISTVRIFAKWEGSGLVSVLNQSYPALVSVPQNLKIHSGLAQDLVPGVDIVGNQKVRLILFLSFSLCRIKGLLLY